MKLEVMAALVLVALGLSSCMAVRHRGTSGVEGSNRPVIYPVAPAPGKAQAHSLTAPSAIYVADFDIDPDIVQTSNDLPSRVMQSGGPLSRLREDALSEGNRVKESVVGFGAGEPHVEISGTIDAINKAPT